MNTKEPENQRTKEPLISVIMNCYNSSKYLKEAIDSVFAQTYTNWEIIFWDNQSTDESAEIFKSYKDERCKYFYASEHTTLGEARNLAVEKANGDWIGFLDCDDLWLPEKLEKQVAILNEEDDSLGLVYGKMQLLVMEEGSKTNFAKNLQKKKDKSLPEGFIFNRLLMKNFVPLLSGLLLKEGFIKVGGINKNFKMAEDYDIFLKITKLYKARAVQEVCCVYRVHGSNMSHTKRRLGYLESILILKRYWFNPLAIISIMINLLKIMVSSVRK
jgi:glycosyltransferase involved in cell wall biosynthesis